MGLVVSIFHIIVLAIYTYPETNMLARRLISDTVFILCINGLGVYFRYMNEIVKRRSFLDRRDFILSVLQLKHEQEQSDQLMSSIIPTHLIDNVKKIFNTTKSFKEQEFNNPLLEEYENVSILFADIVNYTEMTTQLNIHDLLETLNELFGKFDDTSEELKVKRIKFLGDCYYCVAGMKPDPAPNHAEACVDLGLKMISIIANVRRNRKLNVNMRIGIHTGKIIGGIIGSVKYQFDIWSKDVDIANKMETEGCAGKVHITKQTKDLLTKSYDIVPSHKGETVPQFKKYQIETFLVSPTISELPEQSEESVNRRTSLFKKNATGSCTILLNHLQSCAEEDETSMDKENNNSLENNTQNNNSLNSKRVTITMRKHSVHPKIRATLNERKQTAIDVKRRTAFMNNNIKRYGERSAIVNEQMFEYVDKMSFSKYNQFFKEKDINKLLFFNDKSLEWSYIKMEDPLFKYYVFSEIIALICVYLMQNLTLYNWDFKSWQFYISLGIIFLILVPITWMYHTWDNLINKHKEEPPKNSFIRFFYDMSKFIRNNWISRLVIYLVVCFLFTYTVFSEVLECKDNTHDKPEPHRTSLLNLLFRSAVDSHSEVSDCIIPWHMTETCSLAIIMTFLFLRIMMWIKFFCALIITILYGYCVFNFSERYYSDSETINYLLNPQIAHILSVLIITFTLHMIDRQTEYMNKHDYLWYNKIAKEREEANDLKLINKSLLLHILPKHVADTYLDVNREMSDLYHEYHENVAVIFASLIINDIAEEIAENEKLFLNIMNQYIISIDTVKNRPEFKTIEKIKIAKWTYMAACGLADPSKKTIEPDEKHHTKNSIVTLIDFASEMMKSVSKLNEHTKQEFKLRIGISNGAIAAGVVGSKKPLYDIWGDPVNMASRMDTTGVVDKIQVLEETADIIQKLGYECEYRDKIIVKGKNGNEPVPTYFVCLDENYDLIKLKNRDI